MINKIFVIVILIVIGFLGVSRLVRPQHFEEVIVDCSPSTWPSILANTAQSPYHQEFRKQVFLALDQVVNSRDVDRILVIRLGREAVIVFDNLRPQNADEIKNAVDIDCGKQTAVSHALDIAYDQIDQFQGVRNLLILSDASFTDDTALPPTYPETAKRIAKLPIADITVAGVKNSNWFATRKLFGNAKNLVVTDLKGMQNQVKHHLKALR
jgi:hypothetical protein